GVGDGGDARGRGGGLGRLLGLELIILRGQLLRGQLLGGSGREGLHRRELAPRRRLLAHGGLRPPGGARRLLARVARLIELDELVLPYLDLGTRLLALRP